MMDAPDVDSTVAALSDQPKGPFPDTSNPPGQPEPTSLDISKPPDLPDEPEQPLVSTQDPYNAEIQAPRDDGACNELLRNATSDEDLLYNLYGKTVLDAIKRLYSPDTASPKAVAAAQNATAVSELTGFKVSPAAYLENPDAYNEALFGTGHLREKIFMGLAGMIPAIAADAPTSAAAEGIADTAGSIAAAWRAWRSDLWRLPLGLAGYEAEEKANALVRSYIEGKPFSQTKPYGLHDLVPEQADEGTQAVVDLLDMFGKFKAMHAGFGGLETLWDAMAYDKVSQVLPSRKLCISAEAIRNNFGAGTEGNAGDYYDILQKLNLSPTQIKDAAQHGLDVEVPLSSVVGSVDAPWFAKIKDFLRISPDEDLPEVPEGKPQARLHVSGELEPPEEQVETGAKVAEEEEAAPSAKVPASETEIPGATALSAEVPASEAVMPPVAPFGNEPPSPPVQTQSFENSGDYIQSEQPRLDPVEKIGTGGEPASAITSAGAWDRQKAGTPQDWYPRFIAATQVPMVGEPEDKYVKMPETPDFKKWFGDSKVVFKKGESDLYHNPEGIPGIPRMVYHGSVPGRGPGLFHPDEQRGAIILSSSPDWVLNYSGKEAEPIPAYIKIANPLVIKSTSDSPFLPAAAIDEAKAQGRDGIIFDRRFGKYDYAVFSPDQIKSPFNRGIFDLGDSGILNEADRAYDEKSGEIPAPVTTLAISFKEIDEKPVEIIDMPIEGHAVLALLAQQWRNPKYEELRYVYVKQGIIVDHEGITCRLPTVSKAFIGDRLEGIKRLKERIAALGADSLWLVHNHPSGNPDASGEDLNLTVSIGMEIPELQGHVIINSGNYAFIDPKGECDKLFRLPNLPQKWIDPILTAPISHSVLGEQLKTHKDIAKWAKILTSERNKPLLVYLSAVFKVRGLQEINPGGYRDWKQLADVMPKKLVDFGSKCAVLILPERSYGYDFEIGESLVRRGVFYDVVAVSEYGAHSLKKMGVRVEDQKSFGGRPLSDFPPQYIR